ncbi:MAG: LPS-assembly protein LptD, partial [Saprospiraceae bacterium]|nr:LPS-assembly protein LptD [Saprospiraceae bacterium]
MNAKLIHIILLLVFPASALLAQTPGRDTLPPVLASPGDSSRTAFSDTIPPPADSLVANVKEFSLSKDSLDAPVEYDARDSMIYDIAGQKVHLFGNASVKYQTITLEAAHIIFDWKTNIVTAGGLPDSLGNLAGFPKFTEAENEFNAKRMEYNFRTRKGIIYDVTSQQDDIVVHAARSKFVGTAPSTDTTRQRNDIIYSEDAIFTTCTHPEPHFGIRSSRQKVIPNKLVVVGPSNLEIMNVPTPLWLPFGFFPINKGRRTGLLFPRDYEFSPALGFGIKEIGWFFPLGDNFNLSVTGNIYLKGTWGINAQSQYRKRYKYSGSFNLGFDSRRTENPEDG